MQMLMRILAVLVTAVIATIVWIFTPALSGPTACAISGAPMRVPEPASASTANRDLVVRFYSDVVLGGKLEQAEQFLREDYIQHNPKIGQGRAGFLAYFDKFNKSMAAQGVTTHSEITMALAEGDLVALHATFVFENAFTTVSMRAMDMFRVQDGKVAEHWDSIQPCDNRSALMWALTG